MPYTVNSVEIVKDNNGNVHCYYYLVTEHNNDILDDTPGNQIETFFIKVSKDINDSMTPVQRTKYVKDIIKDNIKVQKDADKKRQEDISLLLTEPLTVPDADGNNVYKKSWLKQLKDLGYNIKELPELE